MQRAAGKFIPRLERDLTRGDHSVEGPPSSRKRVKQTRHREVDNVKIEGEEIISLKEEMEVRGNL